MKELKEILEMDKRIRFIAKITYDGEFLDYQYREDLNLEIEESKQTKMETHVSILVDMHRRIDKNCGKVHTTISLRPKIVSIILYSEPILYSISIDKDDDYPELVKMLENEILYNKEKIAPTQQV